MVNQLTGRITAVLLPAITALTLVLASSTWAVAQKAASHKTTTGVDRYTYVPFAGQSVAIDRKTGKLRPPTPEEARQLAEGLKNLLSRSDQGLNIVTHPNGAQSVDLQGRFQSVTLAKIDQHGKASQECVTSMSEAKAFLAPTKQKSSPSPARAKMAHRPEVEE